MLTFPAVALPLADLLQMDLAGVLGISFWMYLLFGITALPWGMTADRIGVKPLLLLFYAGAGASGLAASFFMESPGMLALSLASIGFFSGIYHPAGLGLISKEMTRISVGMGINGMFGNLGLAMAPMIAGVVNWTWGPKAAYVGLGLLNLGGAVLMAFIPLDTGGERTRKSGPGASGRLSAFLILLIAMMLGGVVYRGATVITPAYFELKNQDIFQWLKNQDIFQWLSSFAWTGLSPNLVATSITSFIFLFGMLGQYAGGRAAERYDPRYCYLVFHILTVPAAFMMAVLADIPLVFFSLVYFFFLLGMQPAENTLVATYTPRKFHSSAFGAKFVLTFGVGSLSVKMVEAIQARFAIETVFFTLAAISAVLVCVILFLIRWSSKIKH
jgi:MFS family permease